MSTSPDKRNHVKVKLEIVLFCFKVACLLLSSFLLKGRIVPLGNIYKEKHIASVKKNVTELQEGRRIGGLTGKLK